MNSDSEGNGIEQRVILVLIVVTPVTLLVAIRVAITVALLMTEIIDITGMMVRIMVRCEVNIWGGIMPGSQTDHEP